jgi:hypothetical protein
MRLFISTLLLLADKIGFDFLDLHIWQETISTSMPRLQAREVSAATGEGRSCLNI